jgi:hypothetical protein
MPTRLALRSGCAQSGCGAVLGQASGVLWSTVGASSGRSVQPWVGPSRFTSAGRVCARLPRFNLVRMCTTWRSSERDLALVTLHLIAGNFARGWPRATHPTRRTDAARSADAARRPRQRASVGSTCFRREGRHADYALPAFDRTRAAPSRHRPRRPGPAVTRHNLAALSFLKGRGTLSRAAEPDPL